MIDQRNKNIYFAQAMSDFFKGFIDFKGYSSRKGHWIPTITITLSFIIILLVIAGASILSFMEQVITFTTVEVCTHLLYTQC